MLPNVVVRRVEQAAAEREDPGVVATVTEPELTVEMMAAAMVRSDARVRVGNVGSGPCPLASSPHSADHGDEDANDQRQHRELDRQISPAEPGVDHGGLLVPVGLELWRCSIPPGQVLQ